MLINIHHDFTGDWEKDEPAVRKIAEKPTSAAQFLVHAQLVETLFNRLTHGTRFAPEFPQRSGLLKKVHDELYPIGHFARLHFAASETVMISWRDGNQNFDATLEIRREDSDRFCLEYLEVTTLQGYEDSQVLAQLAASERGIVTFEGDQEQDTHQRKLSQLRNALGKKATKEYPPRTALLVYTDEERLASFVYGGPAQAIDIRASFGAVLAEMASCLDMFAEVHVYSRHEIYCSIRTTSTSQPDTASRKSPSGET